MAPRVELPPSSANTPNTPNTQSEEETRPNSSEKQDVTGNIIAEQQYQSMPRPDTAYGSSPALGPYEPISSSMYNSGGFGLGSGMYGVGAGYGGMGMYGSSYGMMSPGMGMGGPFNGLNQFLFGMQSVLFSLSQAIQIVSMNTQTFNQLFESATSMFDHAIETFHEMRSIESASRESESEEMKKRRRRLRALRWAIVTAVTIAGYKIIRRLARKRGRQEHPILMQNAFQPGGSMAQPYHGMSSHVQQRPYSDQWGGGMNGAQFY